MNFWKRYKTSFTRQSFWRSILLFSIALLVLKLFKKEIASVWIEGLLSKFPTDSIVMDLLFILLALFVSNKVYNVIKNGLIPTLNSVFFLLLLLLFYFLVRTDNQYDYYCFTERYVSGIAYADAFLALICPLILDFSLYKEHIQIVGHDTPLISDDFDPEIIADLNGNGSYIREIASKINSTSTNTSFAIGILGSWGSGKTHFLLSLQKALEYDVIKQENVDRAIKSKTNQVIFFNPWKGSTVESIVDDFFSSFAAALAPFNKSISQNTKKYAKKIFGPGKDLLSRVTDTFFDEILPDPSLNVRYSAINKAIGFTGKRFIVLIDDIDRMNGHEIMQVLRIIRNSASFQNVFFVVTMDYQYTIEALKKTAAFSKEEDYLKKIFQLTITLPPIRKEILPNELIKHLVPDKIEAEYGDKLIEVINHLRHHENGLFAPGSPKKASFLEFMLGNYRDVKRFSNSFLLSFKLLKDEVNIGDLFLLELIKVKSAFAYENLANLQLINFTKQEPYTYIFDEESWNRLSELNIMEKASLDQLKQTIKHLLIYDPGKGLRQITLAHNFYLYFSYQLFNLISLPDFQKAVNSSWREMNETFTTWWESDKRVDLDKILDNITEYKSLDEFEKFIKVFLYNGDKRDLFFRAAQTLLNVTSRNFAIFFKSSTEFSEFVRKILNDADLPGFNRAKLAYEIMIPTGPKLTSTLIHHEELLQVIVDLFKQYLNTSKGYTDELAEFFHLNVRHNNPQRKIILEAEAATALGDYLRRSSENLDDYLNTFIRSVALPNDGRFAFAPFTPEIFGDWNKFENIVKAHVPLKNSVKNMLPFILNNIRSFREDGISFSLTGKEKEMVLNHLRETGQYNF
jgi:predicted KAP-like P-loop ATPase